MNDVGANGSEIPGYRLVRPIGTSGIATVYLATQRSLERQVAVKVMDLPDETAIVRFEQLLRTNARLAYPDIVDIQQIGRTEDGRLFYAMPFLLSVALAQHNLGRKPLKVAALLRAVLGALEYAHRRGIVHGGVKPANVLYDHREHPLLADFGVARCAVELGLLQPGAAAYISPEQARGQPPGQRSDLYSVGVLAFELLTGSPPFKGADPVATAVAHVEQPVPRLPPAMAGWQPWIDKALTKSPERRFQSAEAMAGALRAIDGRGRGSTGAAPRATPFSRKRVLGVAAVVATLLVVLAGWAAWRQHADSRTTGTDLAAIAPNTAPPDPAGTKGKLAAPPAQASTTVLLSERVGALVAQADAQRADGRLFSPRGTSAVEQYLTALILDPENQAATAGIDASLATVGRRLDDAWRKRDTGDVLDLVKKSDMLAVHASPPAQRQWKAARNKLAHRVGNAVDGASRKRDSRTIARLRPLAETLPAIYPEGIDLEQATRQASTPDAGAPLRDSSGPKLVYVPATDTAPAFGAGRDEVTRAEYARFAQATHRAASGCREAYNPFSRMRDLTWQKPGFAQGGSDPAVCVSWNDATAYAAWLSQQTGATYRLPTDAEWRRVAQGVPKSNPCRLGNVDDVSRESAMDNDRLDCDDGAADTAPVGRYVASGVGAYDMYGNVSEWLAGGSAGARLFRGLSWRDGSQHTPLNRKGDASTDVGYTNVGFRVVREIDADHPAPRTAERD